MAQAKPNKITELLEKVGICIASGWYRETWHAARRQSERKITLPEILYVLTTGRHEKSKDKFDEVYKAWNYSIRGFTIDEQEMRVVVSFDSERELLIITAFYLEKRK